jgi:glycosyltransferase involved in cell wall biosynthesis
MLKRLVESYRDSDCFSHEIISLTDVGTVGAELRAAGIKIHSIGMVSFWSAPAAIFKLVQLIRRIKPTIIQNWMYHADLLGGLAARLAGNRNVIWGIRTTNAKAGGTPATAVIMRICARLSRWIPQKIVCAAEASRRAHEEAGYDKSRMIVISNGFDLSRLVATGDQRAELRGICNLQPDDLVVGMLGRFNPAKDQRNFVHAAGCVARTHSTVRFLMVGRGLDHTNAELTEWISETGFANRFILLGERSDVAVCLSAMDVFCLSSRTEGFPNVVGEAMAMKLPCVVTDVGDAAYLVGDTGVVVPRENSAALAEGIERLLKMPVVDRISLGQKARDRIYAEFTMERVRERFDALYRSFLISEA